ncbi:amino acid adenylation domain-containing protein [Streptomyces sp. XM4193]|uniref:non-ribosomal peptide synthetase/type I polyketide synthase n=1 Tax=Streptomyces sp. XM4193 TaxID=2929782 RepID=UPI001FF8683D|nr:non-ribosomal peptide synthetase/type I polyketide synthase [Streptomyces sp. XM4193]MCK1798012.1 amino acid adenylation domain-containing protein [Streptomyces sp. XM4193]
MEHVRGQDLCRGPEPERDERDPVDAVDALLRAAGARGPAGGGGVGGVATVESDGTGSSRGYGRLLEDARQLLGGLRAHGVRPGDPVVLCGLPLEDFFTAFWACVLGGARPAAIAESPLPGTPARSRLLHTVRLLGSPLVLTDAAGAAASADGEGPDRLRTLELRQCLGTAPATEFHTPRPEDTALLMLSSGSTGEPKAVRLTHGGLADFAAGTRRILDVQPGDTLVNWLPLDHSGAFLIYHLLPVFTGSTGVHTATDAVLANPLRWLDLLHEHRAQHGWAPTFAYRLVAEALAERESDTGWDLGGLKSLVCGGERVALPVLRDFLAATAPYGVREEHLAPVWGMAETVTAITWGRLDRPGTVHRLRRDSLAGRLVRADASTPEEECATFVASGSPAHGTTLRIVGEDGAPAGAGHIGRLQLRAPARLTPGYVNNPAADAEAYPEGREWLDTGDLAFLDQDQVVVTGRRKDILVLNGHNVSCHEVEDAAARVPGVRLGEVAACGVPHPTSGTEELVLLFVSRGAAEDERIAGELRATLFGRLRLTVGRTVPVAESDFPRTPAGKVRRQELRSRLLTKQPPPADRDGGAPQARSETATAPRSGAPADRDADSRHKPADVPPRADGVARVVREELARLVGRPVEAGVAFYELGLTSVLLARLRGRLEERLGVGVPSTAAFAHPTAEALAARLTALGARAAEPRTAEPRATTAPAPAPAGDKAPPGRGGAAVGGAAGRQDAGDAGGDDRRLAVIGMALRFPGARTPEQFWDNLREGVVSLRRFDEDELAAAGLTAEQRQSPEFVPVAGVLDEAEAFDAEHFGIAPKEARLTHPAHRLFLEVCHRALEDGGYAGEGGRERIAVFAGSGMNLYDHQAPGPSPHSAGRPSDPATEMQTAIGRESDFLASRVAHRLGLKGPAVGVRTACSSSLVAVHLAGQAVLSGDADLALAGAAAVHLPQESGYRTGPGSVLSPTGRCRTFDAEADGTVGGNGVAVVLLKRLDRALADSDTVHAVVLGSAINNDGREKVGFTAPGVPGQVEVVRQALARARVPADSLSYVEAHGTGTPVGDPVELEALSEALGEQTDRTGFCAVGSVKPNIGHLDSCAGMAGLIKTILSLRHRTLVPTPGLTRPHPELRLEKGPLTLVRELRAWTVEDGVPRRAGVSALGVGGTNAHVVLEEAPERRPGAPDGRPWLIPLSARSPEALVQLAGALRDRLRQRPAPHPADVATTLALGRPHHPVRDAVVGSTADEIADALEAVVRRAGSGDRRPGGGGSRETGPSAPVWAFAGQGSPRRGMSAGLYAAFPAARRTLEQCADLFRREFGGELLPLLLTPDRPAHGTGDREGREAGAVGDPWPTDTAQAALFSHQAALVEVWRGAGVQPALLLGHSVGEYAALYAAGALTLADGVRLTGWRGGLMESLGARGAMLAVRTDRERAQRLATVCGAEVAAVNGPASVVLSGDPAAIDSARELCAQQSLECRTLPVDRAFHSAAVEAALAEFAVRARRVRIGPLRVPLVSCVDGAVLEVGARVDAEHLCRQARQPVRFDLAMAAASRRGGRDFVEMGADRTLTGLGRHCLPGSRWVLAQGAGEAHEQVNGLLSGLGSLYRSGAELHWGALCTTGGRVPLPGHPMRARHLPYGAAPDDPAVGEERAGSANRAPVDRGTEDRADAAEAGPVDGGRVSAAQQAQNYTEEPDVDAELLISIRRLTADKLGRELAEVGPDSSFFELGADSLSLMGMTARLRELHGVRVPVRELFETVDTPRRLAERVRPQASAEPTPVGAANVAPGDTAARDGEAADTRAAANTDAAAGPTSLPPVPARRESTPDAASVVTRHVPQQTQSERREPSGAEAAAQAPGAPGPVGGAAESAEATAADQSPTHALLGRQLEVAEQLVRQVGGLLTGQLEVLRAAPGPAGAPTAPAAERTSGATDGSRAVAAPPLRGAGGAEARQEAPPETDAAPSTAHAPTAPAPTASGPATSAPAVAGPTAPAPAVVAAAGPRGGAQQDGGAVAPPKPPPPPAPAPQPGARSTLGTGARCDFSLYFFGDYPQDTSDRAPQEDPDRYGLILDAAEFADRHGFHALWFPERHFNSFGSLFPNPSVLAAALATRTRRIRLQAGSVVLPLHHPIRVAEEWSVVDNLSGGRAGLCIAGGWHATDFALAPQHYGRHREVLYEQLADVRTLWSGRPLATAAGDGSPVEVTLHPRPVQRELPMYVAVVSNPDSYRRAAAEGLGVVTNLMTQTVEQLAQNIALYRRTRAEHGLDPAQGRVVVLVHTYLGEDGEQARAQAYRPFVSYLRSSLSLFDQVTNSLGFDVDLEGASEEDVDFLLSRAYDRYCSSRALIGDEREAAEVVEGLVAAGADEIACFVDFGVPREQVVAALPVLDRLRRAQVRPSGPSAPQPPVPDSPRADYTRPHARVPEVRPLPAGPDGAPPQPAGDRDPSTDHRPSPDVTATGRGTAEPGVTAKPGRQTTGFPLTPAQRRIWFLEQLHPGSSMYHEPKAVLLEGALDTGALRESLRMVVARHSALRTVFGDREGVPFREVRTDMAAHCPVEDHDGATVEEALRAVLDTAGRQTFDLAEGPLFLARLLRLSDERHLLFLLAHHIVFDSSSTAVLVGELAAHYRVLTAPGSQQPVDLGELAAPEAVAPDEREVAASLEFWRDRLAGAPELELPTDRPRPAVRTGRGASLTHELDGPLVADVCALAAERRATPFMALTAAIGAVLARFSGQRDLVVGTAVSARSAGQEELIGLFLDTVPLRLDFTGDPDFPALLLRVREAGADAYEHREVPFEELVERLNPRRDPGRNPLFQVMVEYERESAVDFDPPAVRAALIDVPSDRAPFDLSFYLTHHADGVRMMVEYDTALFDAVTVRRLVAYTELVLRRAVESPAASFGELTAVSDADRTLLDGLGRTAGTATYEDATLHALVLRQAVLTPGAVAVEHGEQRLSYGELALRIDSLARLLRARGAGRGSRVAVLLPRGAGLIVALPAVLASGAAYVPLDPGAPTPRLADQLLDSAPVLLLATEELLGAHPGLGDGVPVQHLDTDGRFGPVEPASRGESDDGGAVPEERAQEPAGGEVRPEDTAYLLYTSGSTGRPKAVVVPHRGPVNLVRAQLAAHPPLRTLQWTSAVFDVSVQEIFTTLASGAALVLVDDRDRHDPAALAEVVRRHGVNRMFMPYTPLKHLVDSGVELPSLRELISAGEALEVGAALKEFLAAHPGLTLYNQYGPTEASIIVTSQQVDPRGPRWAPIGRPVPGAVVELLDDAGRPVPVGVTGEIHLGGVPVAHGYHARPQETEAAFTAGSAGARYRTGDLGRWNSDGTLQFLGRIDDRVKIRGHRVEPGEVQAALAALAGVRDAVVLPRRDRHGQWELVAHVVGADADIRVETLREALAEALPDHLVPRGWVVLDRLPVNAAGKLDRARLPEPGRSGDAGGEDGDTPASTDWERALHAVWCEELELGRIGVTRSFFSVGGHSLSAVRLVNRISALWKPGLSMADFFRAPTIRALARMLEQRAAAPEFGAAPGPYEPARTPDTAPEPEAPAAPWPAARTAPAAPADSAEAANAAEGAAPQRGDAGTDGTAEVVDSAPMPATMRRLWLRHHQREDASVYNIAQRIDLEGALDPEDLRQALAGLVARHGALRSRAVRRAGRLVVEELAQVPVELPVTELPDRQRPSDGPHRAEAPGDPSARSARSADSGPRESADAPSDAVERWCREQVAQVIAMDRAPLFRFRLARRGPRSWTLLTVWHHAVCDGWSFGVLWRDLGELYRARVRGEAPRFAVPAGRFTELARAESERDADRGTELEEFWRAELKGTSTVLALPHDRPRPPVLSGRGALCVGELEGDFGARLAQTARSLGATPYSVLAGAFAVWAARRRTEATGRAFDEDLVLTVSNANRLGRGREQVVGLVGDAVPLRAGLGTLDDFPGLVRQLGGTLFSVLDHQDLPLGEIVDLLEPGLPAALVPNVLFTVVTAEPQSIELAGLSSTVRTLPTSGVARTELYVVLAPHEQGLTVTFEYSTDLFSAATVESWSAELLALLRRIVHDPELPLSELLRPATEFDHR